MPPRPALPRALFRQPLRSLQTTALRAQAAASSPASAPAPSPSAPAPAASSSSPFGSLPPLLAADAAPELPNTTAGAVDALRAQSASNAGIYLRARLHSRTYLLHPRDILTVPTLKPLQPPGTTMALTRILEVGSRDFAIRSPAADGRELRKVLPKGPGIDAGFDSIPPWVASCELTVLEHTKSPLTHTVLKKRRKGYKKTLQNKQGWTRLRVGDIILGDGVPPPAAAESA